MTYFEFLVLVSSHPHGSDCTILAKEFLQTCLQSGFLVTEPFLMKDIYEFNDNDNSKDVRHKHSSQIDLLVVEVQSSS